MSTELQQLNEQKKLTLWAERITECRNSGLTVKTWCKENGVGEQSYYKWCILRRPVVGGAVLSGRWAPQWSA